MRNRGHATTKVTARAGLAALACVAFMSLAAPVKAAELVSNIGQVQQGSGVFRTHDHAQAFTTGSNTDGYKLTSIEILTSLCKIANNPLCVHPTFSVSIWSSTDSGQPDSSIATLVNPDTLDDASDVPNTFTASGEGIDLDASTTYVVVVDVSDGGTGSNLIRNTASNNEDSGGAAGWSIADGGLFRGINSTGSWSTFDLSRGIRINGAALTSSNTAPVFSDATLTRSLAENSGADVDVGAVIPEATDADNDTLDYSMEGTDEASFNFNVTTRQISTKSSVTYNFEATKNTYAVTIRVSDGTDSDTVAVTISLTNVNEPPDEPDDPTVSPTPGSTTSLDVSWEVPNNDGRPAEITYDLRYRVDGTPGWDDGPQDLTGTSATITGLTANTTYDVQVRATNAEGDSTWSDTDERSTSSGTPFNPPVARVLDNWALTPSSLNVGDRFRLLSVSSDRRDASASSIAVYNTFVQNDVSSNGHADIRSYASSFRAIGCSETVDAIINTGTPTSNSSVSIHWLGGAKVADNYSDLYDGGWDSNVPKHPDGTDAPNPGRVLHGCISSGGIHDENYLAGGGQVAVGYPYDQGRELQGRLTGSNTIDRGVYGLSQIFQVVANTPPTASDNSVTTDEDTAHSFAAANFNFADTDGDSLSLVEVVTLPSDGTLTLDGTDVTVNQDVTKAQIDADDLVFTPAANANGTGYASFTFKVSDGTDKSADAYTMTVNVTAVNDAATGLPTIGGTARVGRTLTAATTGIADVDGLTGVSYTYQWVRVDGSDETDIASATGGTYTLVDDDLGKTVKVEVSFTDDDGNDEGPLTSAETATVVAAPVNAPPTASNGTVTTDEDTAHSFAAANFNFADTDGDELSLVEVVTLPSDGTLTLDGTDVTVNQDVPVADIGDLVFTPAADANGTGYASFTFKVSDGTDKSADAYTMTVNVTAVNDAATGLPTIGGTARVGRTLTAATTGIADVDGLTGVSYTYQWVRVDGSDETDIASATGGTYTLVDDDLGKTVKVEVSFTDDDGNDEGPLTSAETATVVAAPVNAPPTASNGTVTTDEDTAHSFAAANFNFADTDSGDMLTIVEVVTLPSDGTLTFDGNAATANLDVPVADIGDLVFTPAANANGDDYASFTFKVSDGTDKSADAYTMTVNVTAVNDAPTGLPTISGAAQVGATLTAVTTDIADADGLPASFTYQWVRVDGSDETDIASATGATYTLVGDDEGNTVKVEVSFTDAGGTDEGPLTSAETATIMAAPTNNAPVFSDATLTRSFAENSVADVNVGAVIPEATDADLGATLVYSMEGADMASFNFDVTTRQITTKTGVTYDFEATKNSYSVTIRVSDGTDSDTVAVTINLTNVIELPSAPTGLTVSPTLGVGGSLDASWTAPTNTGAPAVIDYDLQYATSSSGPWSNGPQGVTGTSSAISGLNATRTRYYVRVSARNVDGDSAWSGIDDGFTGTTTTSANCPAPTLTGRARIWSATVSVGNGNVGQITYYGFNSVTGQGIEAFGALSDTSFQIGTNLYTVGTMANGVSNNAMFFTLDSLVTDSEKAELTLHVCNMPLALSSATVVEGSGFTGYQWSYTADDWPDYATRNVYLSVPSANSAPTATDGSVTTDEDTAHSFAAGEFSFADTDSGDELSLVEVVTLPSDGTLTLDGTDVTVNQDVTKAQIDADDLVFTPAANANGTGYASFTFKVSDGTDKSADAYTMTVNVTAVNDAATGLPTISGTAQVGATLTAATTEIADVDGLTGVSYSYQWVRVDSGTDTDIASATGGTYTLVDDDLGKTVKVEVSFTDDDGNDEGPLTSAETATVVAAPVNAPPTASNGTVTTDEDTAHSFAAANFNFADTDSGDMLTIVEVVTLPSDGTLTFDGNAATANLDVPVADIGDLVFTPAANANGDDYASFTFKVSDGTDKSADAYTMTVNVTAVNDAPTGLPTISGAAQVGATLTAVTTDIADADGLPASFTYQWVRVDGSDETDIASATGATYTLVGDDEGNTVKVEVSFTDAGGTDEGPLTSAETATIMAAPTNNAPVFSDATLTRSFAENSVADVNVGAVIPEATDADLGATLVYSMEGADMASFNFDVTTRQITTKTGVTYDFEATKNSYSVTIRVSDGTDSDTVAVTINLTNVIELPSAPTGLTVSPTLGVGGSLDASWTAPTNTGAPAVIDYDLQYATDSAGPWSNGPQGVTGTSSAISGLNATRTRYYVRVSARNVDGDSAWSGIDDGFTGTTTTSANCPAPTLTGRARIWSATVSVGNGNVGQITYYGFNSVTGQGIEAFGALSDTSFQIGTNLYTVGTMANGVSNNAMFFTLDSLVTDTEKAELTLHVCNMPLALSSATVVEGSGFTGYQWSYTADDWPDYATRNVYLSVPSANSAPTATDGSVTTDEDTAHSFAAGEFSFADTDSGDELSLVEVVTLPSDGTLTLDGTDVTVNQDVPVADIGDLVFTPAANANGTGYASFTFKVSDGTDKSADAYTMTVNVTAVNDAATGLPTIGGTARVGRTLTAATTGIADVDGLTGVSYTYQWVRVDGSDETDIASATGGTYTLVDDDLGKTVKVEVSFTDDDGNDEGPLTSAATATVVAAPVNAPPTASNGTVTTDEDTAHSFAAANFNFADTDGDSLSLVEVVTLPSDGTLTFDGNAATVNLDVAVADIGDLVFTPAANANGDDYASFTFKVGDGTDKSDSAYTMTVNVTAVNDAPTGLPTISGTAQVGATLTAVTTDIADADGLPASFTYQWVRVDGSDETDIASATGATYTLVGDDEGNTVKVEVSFTDEGGRDEGPLTSAATATIMAAPTNNAPVFSDATLTRSVAENSAADVNVGAVIPEATDADLGATLVYSMEGADMASFNFDVTTRQISTRAALDHENKDSYSVTIRVSDGTLSDTVAVTINVTDADEPPAAPAAPTETSKTSTTVVIGWVAPSTADRPAITGYGLQFRAGTTGSFTALTHDGTGTTATVDSLAPNTLYEIQVQALNDEGTGPWSPSLTVTTAAPANNAPVFTEATPVREVAENTSNGEDIGAVIAATDADADDTLSWTLGGTDASSFSIVSTSGQLQTSAGLDFENKSSYAVTVTVSDTKATASVDVTINVTDADEPPAAPAAPTETSKTDTTVVIGWVAPSTADRPAITGYGLQYRAGTTGSFTPETHDGTGTTATVDSLTPSTLYEIQVQASNDEGTGPWSPSLTVTTAAPANNAPVFTEATPVREVAENTSGGEDIGAVIAATDADASDTLSWTLGGTDASSFSIVSTSGQLQTSAGLDFENKSSYAVTVTVSDTKATASVDVTINVADADEPPPAPSAPEIVASTSSSLEVSWVAPSSSGIPALSGFDLQYQATGESVFTAGPQDVEPTATGATIAGLAPNTGYAIQVRAQNAEGEGAWSASLSTSTASNRVPEFDVAAPTFTVAENTAADTAIGTAVTATDPDGDAVTYSLTGTHAANFSIDASGQIATSAALNFEEQTSHALAVQAEDIHGGTASLAVAINVTDVGGEVPEAIEKPQISAITSSGFTVTWSAPANPGPALSAYGIQYRAGSTGPFTQGTHDDVDTTTNTVSGLDAGVVHEVQLRASNADGDGPWSDIETAETEDNASPVFTEATPTREVEENTVADAAIGTAVTATDANDTELTYTLGGADADSFAIVAATGQLQTSAALNYEVETSYAVTVTATDDQDASAAVAVAITVADLEEPPAAPAAPTFPNSLTSSLEVAWTAPVNTGPAITDYNVQYRAGTSGPFTAATHDGTDTGTTLTGLAADTDHEVQVQATNAEGTGPWSASGTGTTVDNAAPTFDTAGALTFTVSENTGSGASVGDAVAATDSDGGTLTYTLEGADADSFAIVAATGQLQTSAALNYEEQTSHAVVVRVEDGQGGSATKAVTINVTDIAEPPAPPAAPTISGQTLTSFTATWEAPFNTGPAITDYDVRYRPGSSGDYTAVAHDGTGLSTTLAGLTENTSYEVQVQAINAEGSSAWSAAATGTTTTNTAPAFDAGGPVALTVAENTAANEAVGSPLGASDADGDTLTFSIVGVDAAAFAMDAGTGQLSTSATLDFEDDPSYAFTATVADGNGGSASLALTITVTDADEPPLTPTALRLVTATTESLAIEWVAPANAGRPVIDDYDVRYRVTDTIPFSDGPQNVETTSATIDELDVDTSYDVQVRAVNDEGDGDWSQSLIARTAAALNIPPEFPADTAARSVAENTAAQQAIGAPVTASDEDDDTLTYTLEGTNAGLFDIDASSGQLLTRAGLDHESTETIVVTVVTDDGNGGTDTVAVTVSVTDVDEPPLAPVQPTLTAATSTSLTISWVAPSNAGRPDIDNYDVQFRLTSVIDYSDGPQQVDGQSATIMDLTESSEYEIQVRARNDEGEGAWSSTLTAATPAASNNPPVFDTGADQARSIVENTTSGEPVGGPVTATDADGDTLTFSLEGADRGSFTIGSDTGQLRTLAGLDFESKASYALTARVEDGNGGFATIALTITVTDADEPPLTPTALRLVSATASSLTLAWTAPVNSGRPVIGGYDLQYRQVGEEDYLDGPQDVETTTATLTDLSADTLHEVEVRATNAEGDGPWSAALSVRTLAEDAPVTVTIAAVSATVTEGMNAVFTLTRSGDATSALDVGVAVTETGSTLSGTPPTSVTFAAAALTATLTVATVDDTTDEAASTITATIQDGDGYDPGSTSSATVTVADNDETLSDNAQLQTLSLTGVDFGTFQGTTLTYTASVAFGTMQTTVTAVPAEAAASVEIEPADANADDDGHQVSLGVGETGIAVIVTAADNATMQTYRVAVTRLQEREEEMQARQSYATQLAQAISSHTLEAMNVRFVELPTAAPASTSSVFENSPLHGFLPSTGAVGPDGGTADGSSNLTAASAMSSAMNGDLTFDHDRHRGSNSAFHLGNLRNWLGNQRFIQPLNAGSKGGGSGGVWSLWGLASRTDFEYRGADFDLSGDVFTGTLGVDYEVDAWLVGIAVSRSSGDGDVSRIATPIEASSELTIIQPYVRLSITPALQAWATYGAGDGFITSPGSDVENDLQLNLLAVGSHGLLLDGSNGGWGAAINADYLVTRSMLHDTLSAIENEAEGSRARLALEGSRNWLMASGGVLTYFVELGGRFESGEETDQQGLEVRSGFKYRHASGRASVGMDVRSFEAEDDAQGTYEELGVSASIRLSTKHGGKGASLTVLSGWGDEDSRIDGMWSDRHGAAIAHGRHFNVEPRLDTEFGYGFDALREQGLLTPYLGYRYMGRRGDIYRIGAKLLMRDALDLRLENQLHRDERMDRVNLRTSVVVIIRW